MSKSIGIKVVLSILFITILFNIFCLPKSHAVGDLFAQGKNFLGHGKSVNQTINTTELKNTSDYIYNALLAIAVMTAIVVAMVIGIQFMAASADEKAKVKEAILPFIVGCIVVFGAFAIWKIAVNIGNDAEGTITDTSTTYSTRNGKSYCDNCGDEVSNDEKHHGQCTNCHFNFRYR